MNKTQDYRERGYPAANDRQCWSELLDKALSGEVAADEQFESAFDYLERDQ